MNTQPWNSFWASRPFCSVLTVWGLLWSTLATHAVTNTFFVASQTATLVSSNINAITIQSGDYRFTYSADGYWSPAAGGPPTGRFFSVHWPSGVQAQAITAGPLLGNGANITLTRVDGKPFDLQAFTGKLLGNTAGAGGAFEVTPQLNGVDDPNAPYIYDATGYAGQSFPNTPMLRHQDTYTIHLWIDWALTALTLIDTNTPIVAPTSFNVSATAFPLDAGSVGGGGSFSSNSTCALVATANKGWGFKDWTENGRAVSTSANYSFTVRSDRTLVANFLPAFGVTTAASPLFGGTVTGDGSFTSNALVTVSATPTPGFRFVRWTEFGALVSTSTDYTFNIAGDRSLVAEFASSGISVSFDFDSGTPTLGPGQGLPAQQTKNGVTASFSTLAGGWSVQDTFYFWKPALFSGNFLYPSTWGSSMAVEFSQPITNFAMTFFTGEVSSEYDTAAQVKVTAYSNTAVSNPVATGTARGAWVSGAYPEGILSFGSATPFNKVTLEIPSQNPVPSYLLFVDNITVQLASPTLVRIDASVTPVGAGILSGAGDYLPGDFVTLETVPNGSFHFANWTEGGIEVSASSVYSFDATTHRTLVAHFTPNQPPVAVGGIFFQVSGQPLAINILDLMSSDYDPDNDSFSFVGVTATTTNGLALTVQGNQILVPANSRADGFHYTLADSFGATAKGSVGLSIIPEVTSKVVSLDLSVPGQIGAWLQGVPWYSFEILRATNILFNQGTRNWSVRAGADGSIFLTDDFADLNGQPAQAYYRLRSVP